MQAYKQRSVVPGQRVKVYRNLHRQGQFSIMDAATGLVLGHGPVVLLSDAKYYVSEAGRQRVLRENKKYVHAWVEGTFVEAERDPPIPVNSWGYGVYNPRKYDTFRDPHTGEALNGVYPRVWCADGATYYERMDG